MHNVNNNIKAASFFKWVDNKSQTLLRFLDEAENAGALLSNIIQGCIKK